MKRSIFFVVLLTCVFAKASAQQPVRTQDAVGPSSAQSLQELVAEVRQLRAALQRMNATVYKGQVLLERFKLQQEQVTRLSRELAQAREDLMEVRSAEPRLREAVRRLEEHVTAGSKDADDLAAAKAELDSLAQRQVRLTMRETRLVADFEGERMRLNDLNHQLNTLVEIEMKPK